MMEDDSCGQLPPEVWSHILTFVDDFRDIIDLKFVNQIFYQELGSKDPFKAFDRSINISKESVKFFIERDTSYSLPRERLLQAVRRKLIGNMNGITLRTIALGKEDSGKTSFFTYFVRSEYKEPIEPTIGATFHTKKIVDPDGIITRFELWDTGGQERYRGLAPMYYRGVQAVLLCFSIDSRESLVSLFNNFLPGIVKVYGANPKANKSAERPVMYLVGLKSDRENARQVSTNEAKTIARALKLKYFECSAKLGQNVNEIMTELKDDVLKSIRVPVLEVPSPPSERRWCSIQ